MQKDFSGLFDPGKMSDDELRDAITQQFGEHPNLDLGWVDVDVADGFVRLSGTVGTDGEKQIAEKLVTDVVGVENYSNELIVNELHREPLPEDMDTALAAQADADDQLGDDIRQQSDTATHLQEDIETETFGTRDMQQSIQEGATYIPPDRPIADGYNSEENH